MTGAVNGALTSREPDLPEEAFAAALASLPGMTPATFGALLGQRPAGRGLTLFDCTPASGPDVEPSEVWRTVTAGTVRDRAEFRRRDDRGDFADLRTRWAVAAMSMNVCRLWAEYTRRQVGVDLLGRPGYPEELVLDEHPPFVVFRTGRDPDLAGRRVAIVGTRRATPAGRQIAYDFGALLSEAGARIVSGLALGIDGAAHQGALDAVAAAPIGVVAGGFDLPYPARHRVLWQQVAAAGVLVSESPLGVRSEGWRFIARNRIIAGLAEAIVVVESRDAGGSIITADAALRRGITVMAVPGSIRNPASDGTNKLIRDGAIPVCGVEDILTALHMDGALTARGVPDGRPVPSPRGINLLDAMGWEPTPTSALVARTGLDPVDVAVELTHLEVDGWILCRGGWWQRIAERGRAR